MMKKYEKNKDSGIEWMSDIPFHWEIGKLKFNANLNISTVDRHELEDEITVSICHYPQAYNNEKINRNTVLSLGTCNNKEFENFKLKKGQIVITKDSESSNDIGVPTFVEEDIPNAVCGYHLAMINVNERLLNSSFLFRFLQSKNVNFYFDSKSNGVTRFGLGKPAIENLPIPIPSLEEQTAISHYLDHRTTIIDQLIYQKEKLISLLKEKRQAVINEAVTKGLDPNAKMKDSGIEWLGEVPEGWEVKRLKQTAEAFGRIGYRGYTTADIVSEGEGSITISPSNMKGDYMTFENCTFISWEKYNESPEIQIFNNDVLMVKTGSTYGKVGLVKDLEEKATINPQLLVFKNIKINPDYFYNLLRTPLIQYQVETNVIGSTIPTLSQTKILNFQLVIPPTEEIETILAFINIQIYNIDNLNFNLAVQIERLKEYRQSIISEAVTGKIDVRDWSAENAFPA